MLWGFGAGAVEWHPEEHSPLKAEGELFWGGKQGLLSFFLAFFPGVTCIVAVWRLRVFPRRSQCLSDLVEFVVVRPKEFHGLKNLLYSPFQIQK